MGSLFHVRNLTGVACARHELLLLAVFFAGTGPGSGWRLSLRVVTPRELTSRPWSAHVHSCLRRSFQMAAGAKATSPA